MGSKDGKLLRKTAPVCCWMGKSREVVGDERACIVPAVYAPCHSRCSATSSQWPATANIPTTFTESHCESEESLVEGADRVHVGKILVPPINEIIGKVCRTCHRRT